MRRLAAAAALALLPVGAQADDGLALRCLAEVESGNYRLCEQAVAASPQDARMRGAFARALMIAGVEERAIFEYDRAAQLAPDDPYVHFELAAALGALDFFEDAERPLERALALKPDFADAHRLAVILHERLKRWERAFAHSRTLADFGDATAMHDVSIAYELGRGAQRSEAEALAWLVRAAEAGHVGACDRLTTIYLEGLLGVKADETAALEWARKARLARLGLN